MTPKSNTMSRTIRSRWWLLLLLDFSSIFPGRTEKHHSGSPDPCLGRGTSSNGVYQATKRSENNNNAAASQLTIASQIVDWVSEKRTLASYNCCCIEGNNAYISHSMKRSSFFRQYYKLALQPDDLSCCSGSVVFHSQPPILDLSSQQPLRSTWAWKLRHRVERANNPEPLTDSVNEPTAKAASQSN